MNEKSKTAKSMVKIIYERPGGILLWQDRFLKDIKQLLDAGTNITDKQYKLVYKIYRGN